MWLGGGLLSTAFLVYGFALWRLRLRPLQIWIPILTLTITTIGCMLLYFGGLASTTTVEQLTLVHVRTIPTTGRLNALVVYEGQLLTAGTGFQGVQADGVATGLGIEIESITAMDVAGHRLYVADYTGMQIRVYDFNQSILVDTITLLPFPPLSIAVGDDGYLYVSGPLQQVLCIALDDTATRRTTITTFALNDTFSRLRGLVYAQGLLYVADRTRVLVFRRRELVQVLPQILEGRKLAIWQGLLVVTHVTELRFFALRDGQHYATLGGSSFDLTVSETLLYVTSVDTLQVYEIHW